MAKVQIGKAKYGGQKKKYWKLKDGESVFRILPPLGELSKDGKWHIFYKVHYGYKNAENKSRPFISPLITNRQTKMVESPDAAQERIDKLKAQLEVAKKAGNKPLQEQLLKFVGGPKSQYNCDNNHYLNAIDTQGNIGVLKLRHKAYLALDLTIKGLRDKNIDPLGVDTGRFFVFSRSGNALETTFKVEVYKKTMNIEGVGEVEQDVVHKLTEDILERLSDEAAELQKLFKTPTSDQVAQIVAESDMKTGISKNIDDILGFKSNGTAAAAEEEYVDDENEEVPATETAATPTPAATQAATPAQAAPAPTAQVVATPVAVVETKPAAAPAPAAAPKTTGDKVSDMSDAEFLASLGLN